MNGAPSELVTPRPTVEHAYSLVLPPGWRRIALGEELRPQVDATVAQRSTAANLPPDQAAQVRIRLAGMLAQSLAEARRAGGVDFYHFDPDTSGRVLNSTFLVSVVTPEGADQSRAPAVLAALLDDGEQVTAGDSTWCRTETVRARGVDAEDAPPCRRVVYSTPVPADRASWAIVTLTAVADGDPDSELCHLVVELFDAVMSTWRWEPVEAP